MDVLYIWGDDVAAADAAAAAQLAEVTERHVDLADGGVPALAHAARSGSLFGAVGVRASGAGTLRAADAKALAAACPPGVPVALIAERAAPGWLRKALDGRVAFHDATVPRGRAFVGWVRNAARDAGVRLDADGAAVLAEAADGNVARVRSVLWVCRVSAVTAPTAAQLSRLSATWGAAPNAFAAVDHALQGSHRDALAAASTATPAVIAAALRTGAGRLESIEVGDGDTVPRFARRALAAAAARGVTASDLRCAAVDVELATRGLGGDPHAAVDVALAAVATR